MRRWTSIARIGLCARRSACSRRTLARLDVSSRTLFALIEPESCFAGTLFELALASDRSYMAAEDTSIALSEMNFGAYPRVDQLARIDARFYSEPEPVANARAAIGKKLNASDALELGLDYRCARRARLGR